MPSKFNRNNSYTDKAEKALMHMQAKVEKSEAKYKILFENVPLPYQSLDTEGYITDVNQKWLSTLGYEKNKITGHWFGHLLHPGYVENFRKNFHVLKTKGSVSNVVLKLRKADDTYIEVSFDGNAGFNTDGSFLQSYCVFRILTEKVSGQEGSANAQSAIEKNAKRLKSQQVLFETMFNTIKEGVVITDNNRKITHANTGMRKTFGYEPKEIIGKLTQILYADAKEYEAIGLHIKQNSNLDSEQNHLTYYRHKNGEVFPGETFGSKLINANGDWVGTLAIMRDISERTNFIADIQKARKRAEENEQELLQQKSEIKFHNERLESLLRISQYQTSSIQELLDYALKEAITLTKSKIGYIYYYNEETQQFSLNTWSKEVMNECRVMNPQTLYNLEKTGIWGEAVRQRKPIVINNYQSHHPLKKGTPQGHVALTKFLTIPVIIDNQIVAVAGIANKETDYDDTDVRQLTLLMDNVWKISERLLLIDNLKKAKEKAEESNKLKTSFLQNLSHEIRTPMNAISGFSQLLNKSGLTDEKKEGFISIIQESGEQLLAIVNDILTISSLETRQEKVNNENVNINELLSVLYKRNKDRACQKQLSFTCKPYLPQPEAVIFTDKNKLSRILENLLSNAFKFTANGAIEFGYEPKINNKESVLEFYVKDTGIGIHSTMQNKVFERFCQADDGLSRTFGGAGLGLSISKGFVTLLDGNIWMVSEPGAGSTFYFSIPYNPVKAPIKNDTQHHKTIKSNKVLVAEDEAFNFIYIKECLTNLGIQPIHAKNGNEAIALVKSNPDIALILMDIKMPDVDGATAATKIREFNPDVPIIAQSAYALEHEVSLYRQIFNDYLVKPIREENLRQTVEKYVSQKRNLSH